MLFVDELNDADDDGRERMYGTLHRARLTNFTISNALVIEWVSERVKELFYQTTKQNIRFPVGDASWECTKVLVATLKVDFVELVEVGGDDCSVDPSIGCVRLLLLWHK